MISVRNAGAGRSLLAIAGVILGVSFAGAATRTWTGAADSDWHNAANWTPSDNWPQAGDSVAVSGGHVVLSNSTPLLSSFSIGNATLVFTNWGTTLSADSITVQSGGVLTLPGPFTNTMVSNSIVIECTNLTVDAGGSINGDGGGYAGGRAGFLDGNGPGGGKGSTIRGGGGGGHGGPGGVGYDNWVPRFDWVGLANDDEMYPQLPGSGGGCGMNGSPAPNNTGGAGGGAIRITANGSVTVNGAITANGLSGYFDAGSQFSSGCGAGGSIWIRCSSISGSGTIRAAGGNQLDPANVGYQSGGGGGGGRIAIHYDPASQALLPVPSLVISAAGGWHAAYDKLDSWGHPGTVYLPDSRFMTTNPLVRGQVIIPSFTNWSLPFLNLTGAWIRIMSPGLRIEATNGVFIGGSNRNRYRLEVTNAAICSSGSVVVAGAWLRFLHGTPGPSSLSCSRIALTNAFLTMQRDEDTGPSLSCGSDFILNNSTGTYYFPNGSPLSFAVGGWLVLTNSATLDLWSGATNGVGATNYGGLVAPGLGMWLGSNCWILSNSHPTNGGSLLFRTGALTIAATNSGFNATGRGFDIGAGVNADGRGPGRGKGGWNATGGGHGGLGGKYIGTYGQTYGSSNAPIDAGSSGGSGQGGSADVAGSGGGCIRLEVDGIFELNGMLLANGRHHAGQNNYGGGGGAGGSIYIKCKRFAGQNPVLSAAGGNGCDNRNTAGGGGGAGGRIAVWRVYDSSIGVSASVAGGMGYRPGVPAGCGSENGQDGTVVWGWLPEPGTVFVLH